MTPAYQVVVGGLDITAQIADRLLQLEVTDGEGVRSDRCSLMLDDRNARVSLPPKGTLMRVSMGYRETGLAFMGTFKVSDVSTNGYPRQVSIQAEAADMKGKLKQTRNHSYTDRTISDIVGEIAGRHGLTPRVASSLAGFRYRYLPQTGESDMNLLTGLAGRHDALFKVANGMLIFGARGEGLGAGRGMGVIVVQGDLAGGGQVKRYSAKAMARPAHRRVVGAWWDRVGAAEEREEEDSDESDEAELLLTHRGSTRDEARAGARSRGRRSKREKGGLSLEIVGNPAVGADMTLVVVGVRPGSADGTWRVKTAKHQINNSGFTTDISAELPGEGNRQQGQTAASRVPLGRTPDPHET